MLLWERGGLVGGGLGVRSWECSSWLSGGHWIASAPCCWHMASGPCCHKLVPRAGNHRTGLKACWEIYDTMRPRWQLPPNEVPHARTWSLRGSTEPLGCGAEGESHIFAETVNRFKSCIWIPKLTEDNANKKTRMMKEVEKCVEEWNFKWGVILTAFCRQVNLEEECSRMDRFRWTTELDNYKISFRNNLLFHCALASVVQWAKSLCLWPGDHWFESQPQQNKHCPWILEQSP